MKYFGLSAITYMQKIKQVLKCFAFPCLVLVLSSQDEDLERHCIKMTSLYFKNYFKAMLIVLDSKKYLQILKKCRSFNVQMLFLVRKIY